jgi:hypothetical protein
LILAYEFHSFGLGTTIFFTAVYALDAIVEYHTLRRDTVKTTFNMGDFTLQDWQSLYILSGQPIWDLISIFPFDLLPFQGSEYMLLIRLIRVPRLAAIMSRSPIYSAIIRMLEHALAIGEAFQGIFSLTFLLCMYLHVQACIISIMGRVSGSSNPIFQAQYERSSTIEIYTWSLFQAVGNTFPLTYRYVFLFVWCAVTTYS